MNNLKKGTSCIIFSMDRAMQLHALLGSLLENLTSPIPIFVIYRPTSEIHENAYNKVIAIYSNRSIIFIEQKRRETFRDQLLKIIDTVDTDKVFFLVDDILVTETIDPNDFDKFDPETHMLSLRLGQNLTKTYNAKRSQPFPIFLSATEKYKDMICWKWDTGRYDWNYPISVDGHIFSTIEILSMSKDIDFNSPNTFEGNLQIFTQTYMDRYGLAYKKSKLFNIPCNRVQNDMTNRHGNIHQDDLLMKWQEGYQINYRKYYHFVNTGVHQDVVFDLIKRDRTDPNVPKVSVIMPVYNSEKYVREAIDSILSQTYSDFELIIINDGSTDSSVDIVKSYNDRRIRFINNVSNSGLAVTRNQGLKLARGEYIANLDSDDRSYPERIERQVKLLDIKPDFGLVGTYVEPIDKNGHATLHDIWSFPANADEIPAILFFNNYFAQSATMIRKSALREMGYRLDLPPAEDYDLWIRISENSRVWNLHEVLTQLRSHESNTSQIHKDDYPIIMPKIYTYQLTRLGVSFNQTELYDHYLFCSGQYRATTESTDRLMNWLCKLIAANSKTRIYDKINFSKAIIGRWYLHCKQMHISKWSTMMIFLTGLLTITKDHSVIEKLRMICTLSVKYFLYTNTKPKIHGNVIMK